SNVKSGSHEERGCENLPTSIAWLRQCPGSLVRKRTEERSRGSRIINSRRAAPPRARRRGQAPVTGAGIRATVFRSSCPRPPAPPGWSARRCDFLFFSGEAFGQRRAGGWLGYGRNGFAVWGCRLVGAQIQSS